MLRPPPFLSRLRRPAKEVHAAAGGDPGEASPELAELEFAGAEMEEDDQPCPR